MATIEHPMTSHSNQKDIPVKPQQMRELTVMSPEDEELVRKQMEELSAQAAREVPEPDVLLDDPIIENELKKKRALENLVLFNKPHVKRAKVGSVTFTMKLLTAHDSDEVYQEVLKLPSEDQVTRASRMLLAASIMETDGLPLETAYTGPDEITSKILQKYYIISSWPVTLANSLNRAYQTMVKESEKEFDFDFLDQ